jgi:Raf kinase inhibitor-like YbhB/YbcL family protein
MKTRIFTALLFLVIFVVWVISPGLGKSTKPLSASRVAADLRQLVQPQVALAGEPEFRLSSSTFENNQFVPSSMVYSGQLGSVCTGNNISPELSWTNAGRGTRSYTVALYDVTANFTHWGIYNIPATTTELAAGSGTPGSGQQVYNDAGVQGYSGPCPPPDLVPNGIHSYVFTVYALDKELDLTPSPDFPPGADGLYRAMIGHVIDHASITGRFKCPDSANTCS